MCFIPSTVKGFKQESDKFFDKRLSKVDKTQTRGKQVVGSFPERIGYLAIPSV
jgi:hypothetical protein